MSEEKNNNYVLTNCLYEDAGDRHCYEQVKEMSEKRNSIFIPVKLLIEKTEHIKRITNPSRRDRLKSSGSSRCPANRAPTAHRSSQFS